MKEEIKRRSKEVALEVINMSEVLPTKIASVHIAKQVVRSTTSVAANYRAVCRARSDKEFIAKLGGRGNGSNGHCGFINQAGGYRSSSLSFVLKRSRTGGKIYSWLYYIGDR